MTNGVNKKGRGDGGGGSRRTRDGKARGDGGGSSRMKREGKAGRRKHDNKKESLPKKREVEAYSEKEMAEMQAELDILLAMRPVKSVCKERDTDYNWYCGEDGGDGVNMKTPGVRWGEDQGK